MAKTPTKTAPIKRRAWIALAIACGLGVALFALGAVAGYFYWAWTQPKDDHPLSIVISSLPHDTTVSPTAEAQPQEPIYHTSYYEFEEPFTGNLRNSIRITQAKIALSTTYEDSVLEAVRVHQLPIRAAILSILSDSTEAELHSEQGKLKIEDRITAAANEILLEKQRFPGIEHAYITSLTMQ